MPGADLRVHNPAHKSLRNDAHWNSPASIDSLRILPLGGKDINHQRGAGLNSYYQRKAQQTKGE
jgi:hypothetical protein